MGVQEVGKYLVVDPKICFGRLTFKGTRLPVETILNWLAKGKTIDSILSDWPYLARAAIAEAVFLASEALLNCHERRSRPHDEPVPSRRATRRQRRADTSTVGVR